MGSPTIALFRKFIENDTEGIFGFSVESKDEENEAKITQFMSEKLKRKLIIFCLTKTSEPETELKTKILMKL